MTRTTASRPAAEIGLRGRLASPSAAIARGAVAVQVLGDPVRVDDRDESIEQRDDVEHEGRAQDERVEDQPDELDPIETQDDPGEQRNQQDRRRGKRKGTAGRARVQVAESGEEQGEERRRERRPAARSRVLRLVHRG